MFSNKIRFLKVVNYLEGGDFHDATIEEALAIERSFEIIGCCLDKWDKDESININRNNDSIVDNVIQARHKISHLYTGLNLNILEEAKNDLQHLKNLVSNHK